MIERPLLITSDLVWLVLDRVKSETRRLRDLDPINERPDRWKFSHFSEPDQKGRLIAVFDIVPTKGVIYQEQQKEIPCPYGKIGDQLWGRETFMPLTVGYGYKADGMIRTGKNPDTGRYYEPRLKWTPSIHMPRKASRIQLEILDLKVERLHDITARSVQSEGAGKEVRQMWLFGLDEEGRRKVYRDSFRQLWIKINDTESWELNPWVWVITFKLLKS